MRSGAAAFCPSMQSPRTRTARRSWLSLRDRQPYQSGADNSPRAIPITRREQAMSQTADERLMTIADLSTMLGVPVDTLYGWRRRGEGPTG
jgi:DNA-binding transcriptional regulator YiaG